MTDYIHTYRTLVFILVTFSNGKNHTHKIFLRDVKTEEKCLKIAAVNVPLFKERLTKDDKVFYTCTKKTKTKDSK